MPSVTPKWTTPAGSVNCPSADCTIAARTSGDHHGDPNHSAPANSMNTASVPGACPKRPPPPTPAKTLHGGVLGPALVGRSGSALEALGMGSASCVGGSVDGGAA